MGDSKENDAYEEELLDYEEDDEKAPDSISAKVSGESAKKWALLFTSEFSVTVGCSYMCAVSGVHIHTHVLYVLVPPSQLEKNTCFWCL